MPHREAERKTFRTAWGTADHDAVVKQSAVAKRESKFINAAHVKALALHRHESRPPIRLKRFAA